MVERIGERVKRFWKEATAGPEEGGWGVALDGKPLRTPARKPLVVPTRALAEAIAGEWNAAGETVQPRTMPLTGLANAAIDHVEPNREQFARQLARYGESDLLCYRADSPPSLAERQQQSWDALLAWARRRFDVDFRTTCGIAHVQQPNATVQRLGHAFATLDAFRLAALSQVVTIGGSLVAALALLEGAIGAEAAWDAVTIDDRWQIETWGADPEAEAALDERRREFFAAARFLELLEV
jgi:chaperone required for assembly of F1-ATPase